MAPATRPQPGPAKALLVYNAARLGLLAACLGLGYLAGLRGFALIIAALLVSGVLSWFLLTRQRVGAAMAVERAVNTPAGQRVTGPVRRWRSRIRERVEAEDRYVDQMLREQADQPAAQAGGADAPR